jgi:hypothetical protein
MTVFVMFFIEIMASRFDFFGENHTDLEARDPAMDLMRNSTRPEEKYSDAAASPECEYYLTTFGPVYLHTTVADCITHRQDCQWHT